MIKFYTVDTETTGLNSRNYYHEITEIGVIRNDDRVQLFRKIKAETPQNSSLDALRITGKTKEDLKQGYSRLEVVNETNKFFNLDGLTPAHRCIVGHNIISFDRKFLHALWASVGQEFPASLFLDTITLTQEFIKRSDISTLNITKTATGKISKALHAACDLVGIKKLSAKHNAKTDSQNNYLLFEKLKELKIDYLPHIKTFIHSIKPKEENVEDQDLSDIF